MKYPIDTVSFSFQMMEETLDQLDSRPEDGCYVYGLFLEGARWDRVDKGLIEPKPKVGDCVCVCVWGVGWHGVWVVVWCRVL
jgi:Dynein heavy chain C-terminal domain